MGQMVQPISPQFDMTDEQIKLAYEAGLLATSHLKGGKLDEGMKIGEALLVGRNAAMTVAGTNKPQGKNYSKALYDWKRHFNFPTGKESEAFYDEAIVCAQNRVISDQIIASLSIKQRAELGVFGLAKRVRDQLKPKKPRAQTRRASREAEFDGRLADMEERQMSEEPLKWWRDTPEEIGRVMARVDGEAFRRLAKAGLAALDDPRLLSSPSN
jgi:hypothetical protein